MCRHFQQFTWLQFCVGIFIKCKLPNTYIVIKHDLKRFFLNFFSMGCFCTVLFFNLNFFLICQEPPYYCYKTDVPRFQKSHRRCSVKKGALRNFAKFTGKHLRQALFNKVARLRPPNTIKKESLTQVFSWEFCEISKNTFITEHLWTNASEVLS